jgi:rubrerythrin
MSRSGSTEPTEAAAKGPRFSTVEICRKLFELIAALERRHASHLARQDRAHRRPPRPSAELRALCLKEISVERYLLLKLDAALEPLAPLLPTDQLDLVRAAMQQRLRSEPTWVRIAVELRERLQRETDADCTVEARNDR